MSFIPRTRETVFLERYLDYPLCNHYSCDTGIPKGRILWTTAKASHLTSYEAKSITDVVCDDISVSIAERKRLFHPVKVTKVMFSRKPSMRINRILNGGQCHAPKSYYGPFKHPEFGCGGHSIAIDTVNKHFPELNPYPTSQEIDDAKRRIKPTLTNMLEGTVNIYEILGELTEVRKLLDFFKKPVITSVPTGIDAVTGKYLGYRFGIKPTVSLIQNLLVLTSNLDNMVDKWNKAAYASKTWDFHETIKSVNISDSGSFDSPYSRYGKNLYDVSFDITAISKLHIYFRPKPLSDDLRFKLKLRAFGLHKPLTGLWELIPWSWAIDYFVNIQSKIERWEESLHRSLFSIDMVSAGYSVKVHRSDTLTRNRFTCDFNHSDPVVEDDIVNSVHDTYERIPLNLKDFFKNLTTPSGTFWSIPTLDQSTLLGSALWQSRRRK